MSSTGKRHGTHKKPRDIYRLARVKSDDCEYQEQRQLGYMYTARNLWCELLDVEPVKKKGGGGADKMAVSARPFKRHVECRHEIEIRPDKLRRQRERTG